MDSSPTTNDKGDVAAMAVNAWGANHCAMSYGHIGADLIALASMRCVIYGTTFPRKGLPSIVWNIQRTAVGEVLTSLARIWTLCGS
jgi:L-fucose isomerase-like protein